MPQARYINVSIDDQRLDLESAEETPISISYKLEDPDNFQNKKSTEAFNIKAPATLNNDTVGNTFHNPGIEDFTADNIFRRHRRGVVEGNGIELVVGKCFLINVSHGSRPIEYEYNFYGNNADWVIDLKEATLFEFLKHINFIFNQASIESSWAYDGTDEALPYTFAPVRYAQFMNDVDQNDSCYSISSMRPSLSPYWILYWGFKSVGYRISSDFFDTDYFRRFTMPWTWGGFLNNQSSKFEKHRFLAKSVVNANDDQGYYFSTSPGQTFQDFIDLLVSNDSTLGGYDNNDPAVTGGDYTYVAKEMKWTYNSTDFGPLNANLSITIFYSLSISGPNSDMGMDVNWYKNGVLQRADAVAQANGPILGTNRQENISTFFFSGDVVLGDTISAKMNLRIYRDRTPEAVAHMTAKIMEFTLDYFRIPLGGTINFDNYDTFKKWKFLDLFRGISDSFNLSIQTDPINKVVYLEPTHPYSLEHDQSEKTGGYFNGNYIDWQQKQDINKTSELPLFSDSERELTFQFKNDTSDGVLKKVQDRNLNVLASGKYVLPDRFKSDKKEYPNRFFSATMHFDVNDFKDITGITPQMICIVPENVSNTSASEAENTFEPKLAWYKGLITGVGGWKWRPDPLSAPIDKTQLPYMFAVNYKPGGEEDPIISYSDERISGGDSSAAIDVVGVGLLRRFYLQRLAIMRNGQYYNTWFKLNNIDVTNWLHREHIICRGQKWELVEIKDYKPLLEETTAVFMRKWSPVLQTDRDNVFPSEEKVADTVTVANSFDTPYSELKCLYSDIPKPS